MSILLILISGMFLKGYYMQECDVNIFRKGFLENKASSSFGNSNIECPKRVQSFRNVVFEEVCYFNTGKKLTQKEGINYCKNLRSHMAEPTSESEMQNLCSVMYYKEYFVGFYFKMDGKSRDFYKLSNNYSVTLYFIWEKDEYIDESKKCIISNEDCMLTASGCDGVLGTFGIPCQTDVKVCQGFVEPDTINKLIEGFCYSISRDFKTWVEAEAACVSSGGFLAEIEPRTQDKMFDFLWMYGPHDEIYVGGYKLEGEDKVRLSFTGSKMSEDIEWDEKPSKGEAAFVYFRESLIGRISRLNSDDGKRRRIYVCQKSRNDPCKTGIYFLGGCYKLKDDYRRYDFDDCQAYCKKNGGSIPEPRTKRQWYAVKEVLKIINGNVDTVFIGIKTHEGKAYFYSDYQAGMAQHIDCLDCHEIEDPRYYGDRVAVLEYDFTKDFFKTRYTRRRTKCMCKFDCPKNVSRCYGNNFDYDENVCNECPEDHYGADCTVKCNWEACDMQGNYVKKCVLGRYGPNCDQICSSKCKDVSACSVVTGTCPECSAGYWGLKCEIGCGICTECDSQGICTSGCPPKTYGNKCEKRCPENCANGNCDIKIGICNECKKGYRGYKCDSVCQGDCEKAEKSLQTCKKGTFGELCNKNCSSSCLNGECSRHLGTCNGCVEGFFGLFCERECITCNSCHGDGNCNFDCVLGFYGEYCEKICSTKCKDQNCDKNGYCRECKDGFYGDFCSNPCNGTVCAPDGSSIDKCVDRLFGVDCEQLCSLNCLYGTCSQITGACHNCIPGYYGEKCEKRCTPCDVCKRNGICIDGCPSGKFGINCAEDCKGNCLNKVCDMATGHCMECSNGLYKTDCSANCTNGGACDIKTGETVKICKDGTYGENCGSSCPTTCLDNRCSNVLGNCLNCEKGKYGMKCNKECETCILGCDQFGVCILPDNTLQEDSPMFACDMGFFGPRCLRKCSSKCFMRNCNIDGKCSECMEGYFGDDCSKICPTGKCDMEGNEITGAGAKKCVSGTFGKSCEKSCSSNCASNCSLLLGVCDRCVAGFYGRYCERKCPLCKECDRNGVCTECSDKMYGKKCEQTCSTKCLFQDCSGLNGSCIECPTGHYGVLCDKKCHKCEEGFCEKNGLCSGNCLLGFYGPFCNESCSKNCFQSFCLKDGTCMECPDGYFGFSCERRCQFDACDIQGNQITKCQETRFGPHCDSNCSYRCDYRKCHQVTGHCLECIGGFFGLFCEHMCSHCVDCKRNGMRYPDSLIHLYGDQCSWHCPNCLESCDKRERCIIPVLIVDSNGSALSNPDNLCGVGFYGPSCEKRCSVACLRSDCETDGRCKACPPGKYGDFCNYKCPTTHCDMKGNSLTECPRGTYGVNCDEKCSLKCVNQSCSPSGLCGKCIKGYFGFDCSKTCTGCDECNSLGHCISRCYYGLYGPKCQYKCDKNCLAHNCEPESGFCLECPNEYYGQRCGVLCEDNKPSCIKYISREYSALPNLDRARQACSPGTYGEDCKKKCASTCPTSSCSWMGTCDVCTEGFYGTLCEEECGQCGSCNRGGTCMSTRRRDLVADRTIVVPKCANGLTGAKCHRFCSSKCLASNCGDDGNCRECPNGYYGKNCEKECLGTCYINGTLVEHNCEKGKFGPNCEYKCSPNCLNLECMPLTGTCIYCTENKIGQFCEKKCFRTSECDRAGRALTRCYPGYFGERCEKKCSPNCLMGNCDKDGLCLECAKGFYGSDCMGNCSSTVCDIETGDQIEECPTGWYGNRCKNRCRKKCDGRICTHIKGSCLSCNKGYFGLKCELQCPNCADCDLMGTCLSDCFPGYTGKHCDKHCPENCFAQTCNKSGVCAECNKGFYGELCLDFCPNGQYCNSTGEPVEACPIEQYGMNCNKLCSKSCEKGCSKLLGICSACKYGTYGRFCELRCKICNKGCNRQGQCNYESAREKSKIYGALAGSVALAVIVLVGIVVAFGAVGAYFAKSRKNSRITEEGQVDLIRIHHDPLLDSEYPVSDEIMHEGTYSATEGKSGKESRNITEIGDNTDQVVDNQESDLD